MTASPEMIYGWCLPRILHFLVAVRLANPYQVIFISKYDYSDACRRIVAHSAKAAVHAIVVHDNLSPLAAANVWGPTQPARLVYVLGDGDRPFERDRSVQEVVSGDNQQEPSPVRRPPRHVAWPPASHSARGRKMAVEIPLPDDDIARVDGFIDDLVNAFLVTPENCRRQPRIVPLAMHVTSRPHAGDANEPIPRRPILSQLKLLVEGSPSEAQVFLGWTIDTRRLLIALPGDEYTACAEDLGQILCEPRCYYDDLDAMVGA